MFAGQSITTVAIVDSRHRGNAPSKIPMFALAKSVLSQRALLSIAVWIQDVSLKDSIADGVIEGFLYA